MSKTQHFCNGVVLQDGTELPCICGKCKNDNMDCCLAHFTHLGNPVCPDDGPQTCPDFEPEDYTMSGWIRVTDKLPEDDGCVLAVCYGKPERNVTLNGAFMMAVYDPREGWILDDYPEWENVIVTYWMPIPDTPDDSDYAAKILSTGANAWREMDKEGKRRE